LEAAGSRLPPILMTSVATVAGHFPLVFVTGPGAAARNSIGWVLVTGMISGNLFYLVRGSLILSRPGQGSPERRGTPERSGIAGSRKT